MKPIINTVSFTNDFIRKNGGSEVVKNEVFKNISMKRMIAEDDPIIVIALRSNSVMNEIINIFSNITIFRAYFFKEYYRIDTKENSYILSDCCLYDDLDGLYEFIKSDMDYIKEENYGN